MSSESSGTAVSSERSGSMACDDPRASPVASPAVGRILKKAREGNSFPDDVNRTDRDMSEEGDLEVILSDSEGEEEDQFDPMCPVIRLSADEKRFLRAKWKLSLIATVLGKRIGFRHFAQKIEAQWAKKVVNT
ncbi:uncharacterized protein [Euphorbia lathyris]|uniref:uncharacterized protein isoform X2 n=1 Tax=Euphorbia lathyris TaxID=212925 RepID=UPI0033141F14